jgi:hypothetical protein
MYIPGLLHSPHVKPRLSALKVNLGTWYELWKNPTKSTYIYKINKSVHIIKYKMQIIKDEAFVDLDPTSLKKSQHKPEFLS